MRVLNVKITGAVSETSKLPVAGVTETMLGPPEPVVKLPVTLPSSITPAADCPIMKTQLMVVPPGKGAFGVLVMNVPSALHVVDTSATVVPAKK